MTNNDDTSATEAQPQPFNATKLEPAKKRRRSRSPSNSIPKRLDSRRSPSPSSKRRRSPSPPPRKLKRPGQRARITDAEREQIKQRQIEREKEQEQVFNNRGIHDAVRQHYNAVPERGREWRKTDSRIKGLRTFNNWVKSTLIQKFSPMEDYTPGATERGGMVFAEGPPPKGLLVLDLGCGKGGDLGKWQQAPQPVDLYVGLDPADVSIDQAKERYRQMASRGRGGRGGRGGHSNRPQPRLFQGEFFVQDCFGEPIDKVHLVRDVGFDGSGGPSRFGGGGFDVVTMMFCMHYAFESEAKARQMLKNVAGALKKGGRLIGCIPSSDVIRAKVQDFNERVAKKTAKGSSGGNDEDNVEDDGEIEEGEAEDSAAWGNDIYRVRFPGPTPADGIFRPPFGWKYNYFLHEAVEEVPEYVVPWEAFRALAEEYNLEMQYHKHFDEIWQSEKDDDVLGPLSERMGVRERGRGELLVSPEEMEAASFYIGFCFYKV
ncbi:mRNA capping enzyme-domain-containing protein [Bisporella sp. PMI_857]|nr:mRNA capping enzyme-domain-containing protein [Bisporella sp. PMI_857]